MTQEMQKFFIEETLINPIEKIIKDIEDNKMRDCDVKWCNEQAKKYTKIALESMFVKINVPNIDLPYFNDYAKEKFLGIFNTLLDYFKVNYA